jgi:hypothetical protein
MADRQKFEKYRVLGNPKNARVSLWGKMWSKTLIPFFPNMNGFLNNKHLKWCPTVWELLHHFIIVVIIKYIVKLL